MSEWEEKLNTLLSDPDAMAQVMNMAQNLSQQMGQSGGSAPPPPPGTSSRWARIVWVPAVSSRPSRPWNNNYIRRNHYAYPPQQRR